MKLPFGPIATSLAPLLFVAGPALSGRKPDYAAYPFSGDIYADQAAYGKAHAPYKDSYRDFGTSGTSDMGYLGGEVPNRISNTFREDPYYRAPEAHPYPGSLHSEQLEGSAYQSYPPPAEGRANPWYRISQPEAPEFSSYGYQGPDRSPEGFAPAAASGYRFRGDEATYSRGWDAPSGRPSYRFRPLTAQEHRRMDAGTAWQPRASDPIAEQARQGDFLSIEDAYGYHPDNWFSRHTGVPP